MQQLATVVVLTARQDEKLNTIARHADLERTREHFQSTRTICSSRSRGFR
jgi:hypothetical protein